MRVDPGSQPEIRRLLSGQISDFRSRGLPFAAELELRFLFVLPYVECSSTRRPRTSGEDSRAVRAGPGLIEAVRELVADRDARTRRLIRCDLCNDLRPMIEDSTGDGQVDLLCGGCRHVGATLMEGSA